MFAHLIVRATVADPQDRDAFDRWYAQDHMAKVIERFAPARCWRSWSTLDGSIHYACYEFASMDRLRSMLETSDFKELVEDFSQTWDGKVTRERDVMLASQFHSG